MSRSTKKVATLSDAELKTIALWRVSIPQDRLLAMARHIIDGAPPNKPNGRPNLEGARAHLLLMMAEAHLKTPHASGYTLANAIAGAEVAAARYNPAQRKGLAVWLDSKWKKPKLRNDFIEKAKCLKNAKAAILPARITETIVTDFASQLSILNPMLQNALGVPSIPALVGYMKVLNGGESPNAASLYSQLMNHPPALASALAAINRKR